MGGGTADGSVLVLEHKGAKTGKIRETPLVFINHYDGYVVVASMAGAPNNPGWYHNLKTNPDAVVTIDKKPIPVTATEVEAAERAELWKRLAAMDDRWERYAAKTDRTMPLMSLQPR